MNRTAVVASPLVCMALAACAPVPPKHSANDARSGVSGRVEAQGLAVPAAQRYSAEGNVKYVQALGYPENAMPEYPPQILALHLPETIVRVRLVVDAAGNVTGVAALDDAVGVGKESFLALIRKTCFGWKYSPLLRLDLASGPTTVEEDGATVTYEGRPTALPFHLDYAFRFTQHDGKPDVGADETKPTSM